LHDKINFIIVSENKKKKKSGNLFYDLSMVPALLHTFGGKTIKHEKVKKHSPGSHVSGFHGILLLHSGAS